MITRFNFKNLILIKIAIFINIKLSIFTFAEENYDFSQTQLLGKSEKIFISDGDTIKYGKIRIRLHGIDAPESKQTCISSKNKVYACGYKSTQFLKSLIKNKAISCKGKSKDRYNRLIAVCFADGINLNSSMVKEGWAIAYRYYSKDYILEEESAKIDKKGIWQGDFIEPYVWRKNN